jgi:hypothetical protein
MQLLKTKSKPILKNVVISWYGEINLKILKEKPMNSIRIKAHLNISIMYPLGIIVLTNEIKNHFKRTFESNLGSIPTLQKFITTIWLRFYKKRFQI